MTDQYIDMLGERFQRGERSDVLLGEMRAALVAVENGSADAGFGMGLSAAITRLSEKRA